MKDKIVYPHLGIADECVVEIAEIGNTVTMENVTDTRTGTFYALAVVQEKDAQYFVRQRG